MSLVVRKRFFGAIFILLVQIVLLVGSYHLVKESKAAPPEYPPEKSGLANCRYGAMALSGADLPWLDDLGAGWYQDFGTRSASAPNFAEFVPILFVKQDKDAAGNYLPTYTVNPAVTPGGLGAAVSARPGSLWVVGNEIDRGPNPGQTQTGQGDTYPEVYARAYHEIYHFIKSYDPTAQVAIAALVEVTPGRLQYLDNLWDAYRDQFHTVIPVDVWNMHIYVLPEVDVNGNPNAIANVALGTDPALAKKESGLDPAQCPLDEVYCFAEHDDITVFAEQVRAMRTWMKEHGYQNWPLILSEFSILYPYNVNGDGDCVFLRDEYGNCFTPQRVTNWLNTTFDYLETAVDPALGYPQDGHRLVQQWLWFSVNNEGVGSVSNLVDGDPAALTQMGQAFRTAVYDPAVEYTVNLYPTGANNPVLDGTNGPVTATLMVDLRNNGSAPAAQDFFVTFYKDAALTQLIASAIIPAPSASDPGMTGCARRQLRASVNWKNLGPGLHRYWAKVDSTNKIAETNESDNLTNGVVIVNARQIFLPHLSK